MRGLVACLSSVTEVPLAEIPQLEDVPATHALASSKSWLAGRGFGIVPIAEARSFQWAGWWIAIVDHSDTPQADGSQRQLAVLAFGHRPALSSAHRTRGCSNGPRQTSTSGGTT